MQAVLHTCRPNIISKLSKTRFVAHRVNLLAARPIEAYIVPSRVVNLKLYQSVWLKQCCVCQNRGAHHTLGARIKRSSPIIMDSHICDCA